MREILGVTSALVVFTAYIPYAVDIIRGKVVPARSARIMLTLLLIVTLFQQQSLGSGWAMAVTVGETIGALGILVLSLKRGIGGLTRLDIICYALLAVSVGLWLKTDNALLAIHITIIADTVAFLPTMVKTWHFPKSETPLFFTIGATMPLLSILAEGNYTYAVMLFPLYLAAINSLEVALIYRSKWYPGETLNDTAQTR